MSSVIYTVKMEAATFSETPITIYKITLCHNYYTTLHFLTSLDVPIIQVMYKCHRKPRRRAQSPLSKPTQKFDICLTMHL
jgi:hypothetical protein